MLLQEEFERLNMWEKPKTNWYGQTDQNGKYTGDRFNASDFNRIKNNIQHLRDISIILYGTFNITSLGGDRTPVDYFYADEINQLWKNLNTINEKTFKINYTDIPLYADEKRTMHYKELNKLEESIFDMYNLLKNQYYSRRKFKWNFGMYGGGF